MTSLWGDAACPMCSRLEGRGSQRSATLNVNRHEPLARVFSAAREAAHSQIIPNQKRCLSEPPRPFRTVWFRARPLEHIPAGQRGGEDKAERRCWVLRGEGKGTRDINSLALCRKHFHSVWSLNVNPTWKHHNLLFLLDCHFLFFFSFSFFLQASNLEEEKK